MRAIIILLTFVIFFSCNNTGNENSTQLDSASSAQKMNSNIYTVSGFDTVAANYVDKEIKIKGLVDHVCKHGGKKLFLVDGESNLHVEAEERFNDSLIGTEVVVTGIVREFRVDEAYCLKMEKDNIKSHANGAKEKELFEEKKQMIAEYRDSMKTANTDHLSFYSLEFVSLTK
ncbi:MAG: hypothetical protein U0W24_23580 [Bacteroidales bacterium]